MHSSKTTSRESVRTPTARGKAPAPWKEMSMDLRAELPENSGNSVIWVMTDIFSKQVHIIPCLKIPSARTLAKLFIEHIYRLHGVPECIISDRRVQFTSQFWQEFLKVLGTKQGLSSSHYAQTNVACEWARDLRIIFKMFYYLPAR